MSNERTSLFHKLTIEIVYRILDQFHIFCSMRNVCLRFNQIIDHYHRYQVNLLSVFRNDSLFFNINLM